MKKNLAVIGAGGHGKVVGEIALLKKYKNIHFFDDKFKHSKDNFPFFVKGTTQNLLKSLKNYNEFFVAIGDNKIRSEKIKLLQELKLKIINLIHPKSTLSKNCILGKGICVMANAVINSGSTINNGVIINTSAVVEHDCFIDEFSHISPNCSLSGNVKIGKHSHIGTGSAVHPSIKIGSNVKVGVGAKIFKNIKNNKIFKN